MKLRKRKKAYDCAHHVFENFLVTDDPHPIYNTEDYCKLGKYDNTWTPPDKKVSLCEHCKRFCASRPMIRKQRERKAFLKEVERDCNRNYCATVRAGVAQDDEYKSEYFTTEEDMYKWLSEITNGRVKCADDVEEFNSDYEDECLDDENFIHIHQFDVVD